MKYLSALLLILAALPVFAQNPGYLGKKNVIEVFGTFQTPLFSNMIDLANSDVSYMKKAGKLEEKMDVVDVGYHFNVSHAFSRRFGLAFEFGYDYFSVNPGFVDKIYNSNTGFTIYDEYQGQHENLSVRSQFLLPKIEFTSKGGILPVGITHQIGLGFRSMKVIQKDYLYDLESLDEVDYQYYQLNATESAELEKNLTNFKERYKGMTMVYVLNLRSPVSKNLLLNYGVRYTLNFMKRDQSEGDGYEYESTYWYNEAEVQNAIRSRTRWSFIFLHFGLSFAF